MRLRYCSVCLTTNLRPNASFNEDGVCIACSNHVTKKSYQFSIEKLQAWIKELKKRSGRKKHNHVYDCVIGVSGGKDSTRQALWVKHRLKMNPLLICCGYPPLQMTTIGGNNLSNIISMGFDLELICPAPRTSANLSRLSFEKFGNVCKATEMALFSSVPRIAIEKKIPFIFWGENPATQVGDSGALGENEFDGSKLSNINTLTEGGTNWIHEAASNSKQYLYKYPQAESLKKAGVNTIYLGPVWDDWSEYNNATFASLNGLTLRPNDADETGDITGACMLDEEFTNINMMIKYFKFGFGRATDLVNGLIRDKALSRSEAIPFVEKYDGVCSDEIISKYCSYINIPVSRFWQIVGAFTNQNLFTIPKQGRPKRNFRIGYDHD